MVDAVCDEMSRALRTLARRGTGKEPVVSTIIALGLLERFDDEARL